MSKPDNDPTATQPIGDPVTGTPIADPIEPADSRKPGRNWGVAARWFLFALLIMFMVLAWTWMQ